MFSIRTKLMTLIITSTVLAWGIAGFNSYVDAQREINAMYDAHLAESANAILQQAEHEQIENKWRNVTADDQSDDDFEPTTSVEDHSIEGRGNLLEKRLYFQLWNSNGKLLMDSQSRENAPALTDTNTDGFSMGLQKNLELRVFSLWNSQKTLQIQIAESVEIRSSLSNRALYNVLMPMAYMVIPLIILLLLIVEHSLKPLKLLSIAVGQKTTDDLSSLDLKKVPTEIQPVSMALNKLLDRLGKALENERRFTADAAHELKTPLSAIKIQAQVALQSRSNDTVREHALLGVAQAVDRANHLVEQLLTMARLDPDHELVGSRLNLRSIITEVAAVLAQDAMTKTIDFSLIEGQDLFMNGNESMIRILARNLIDNAIRYAPEHGFVRIRLSQTEKSVLTASNSTAQASQHITQIIVENNRPKLTADQLNHLTKRFSRIQRPSGEGSGLGLAIVHRIVELHHGTLEFGDLDGTSGVRVTVQLPIQVAKN